MEPGAIQLDRAEVPAQISATVPALVTLGEAASRPVVERAPDIDERCLLVQLRPSDCRPY